MFKIALVQNMSELRNYSYADLRRKLHKMNFEVINITRDNINTLISVLDKSLDCVLFASNSLNDDMIYNYVCKDEFIEAFNKYLDNNGATVIMHQRKLSEKEKPLPFINAEIHKLEKKYVGEDTRKKDDKNFLNKSDIFSEQYFVFPNKVEMEEINDNCLKNSSLGGYYWLLLRGEMEDWHPILVDADGNYVIERLNDKKVIFSSLLLDYQDHSKLLQNILINLMMDNMSLAILESSSLDSLGFNYFLNSLESSKLYYKRYGNDKESINDLFENVKLGIHSAILVNNTDMKELPDNLLNLINQYGVKLIQIKEQDLSLRVF